MDYSEKNLKVNLNLLIGKTIKNLFYHTNYEGYISFHELKDEVIEIPLLGVLLETTSHEFYNISSYDYAPYYGLEGLRFFQDIDLVTPHGRPSQINKSFWIRFKNKKIIDVIIINNYYKNSEENIIIPFGIKLIFEGNEECYITSLTLESFIDDKKKYEISHGGGIVLFSNSKILKKHINFELNTFYI